MGRFSADQRCFLHRFLLGRRDGTAGRGQLAPAGAGRGTAGDADHGDDRRLGLSLGIYLLRRWRREGEDQRYVRILKKDREAGRFAFAALTKIWLGQAVLLFLVSSPAQVGVLASGTSSGALPAVALAGLALYLLGVFFEWTGDWQLARFKADPANEGKILDTGLWRYTRHPNYFGDCAAWWGIWLCCAGAGWNYALYTLPGPLFLTFTLTKWSGAALLEAGMKKKRGDKYADYIARTSPFIPWLPKRAA